MSHLGQRRQFRTPRAYFRLGRTPAFREWDRECCGNEAMSIPFPECGQRSTCAILPQTWGGLETPPQILDSRSGFSYTVHHHHGLSVEHQDNPSVTMQEHHVPPGIDQFVTYVATNTRSLPLPCWRVVIALPGAAGGCATSHHQSVSIASTTKEIFHVQTATRR